MNVAPSDPNRRRLRFLVAIASYGRKNDSFLRRIIQKYQSMAMEVDVVVLSEAPKDLGSEVGVVVGLPSKNPWSLPFGHKKIFAENLERYDLFAYSEDDMEVTEQNIQAFLQATSALNANEIAGFLRYEIDPSGIWSLPEAHWTYHWKPESIARRNGYIIGEFTNEHAAFYLLTQAQLRKAIASGGFLRGPCEGHYDMLCTAATDPYTNCGFRKVICLSALEDFLIHHLPDRYVGQLGLPLSSFKEQIKTLEAIAARAHPASTLCGVESKLIHGRWSKSYYEKPAEELLKMVPANAKTVLSIGCGGGATENVLKQRGAKVTALPLDSVIGAVAARLGVEVIYGSWEECQKQLEGQKFDCVLMANLLYLLPNPGEILRQCARFVEKDGTLVVGGPNFGRIPILIRRALGRWDYRKLRTFVESGINVSGPAALAKDIRNSGIQAINIKWCGRTQPESIGGSIQMALGRFWADSWILQAWF
jgi:2-polyprenyl-3-methyl-5-hydroxy-6-metoxy-1,4-benzoquinol methylase